MESRAESAQLERFIHESSDSDDNPIAINPKKKFKKTIVTMNDMPDDILYEIFKYFSPVEMTEVIMNVSGRWRIIALRPLFWRKFVAPVGAPNTICDVLRVAGDHLWELTLTNRYDTNVILAQVARCNKNLRSLTMSRCKGSLINPYIKAHVIKNILIRLPKLQTFCLSHTHCRSLKFFELLGRRTTVEHSDNLRKSKVNSFTYTGILSYKQLLAYAKTAHTTCKITLNDGKVFDSIKKVLKMLEGISYGPRAILVCFEIHLTRRFN